MAAATAVTMTMVMVAAKVLGSKPIPFWRNIVPQLSVISDSYYRQI
jgi:hypothetical protein